MRTRFHNETLAEKNNTWTHDRKQMWLPHAHLCYLILKAARPCVAVLLHGAATSSAISPQMHQQNPADAPPESRGTIRIRRTPTESCLHLQRELMVSVEVDGGENVPGIPGACATRNFTYLVRGPWRHYDSVR